MVAPSLSSRVLDTLLHQNGDHDPEIRALSLATLNDDDWLSTAALFWTQVGWFWALTAIGWPWLCVFIAMDVVLFGIRWRLRRGQTPRGRPLDAGSQTIFAWINLLLVASISIEIFIIAQAPSERAAIVSIVIAIGFCGYVTALFTAFPVLATLNIVMLNGALALGLALGFSDVTRPFAVLSPFITIAYWLLMRRTHSNLLDALHAQHANRRISLHDPLTKLPNRTFMREKLAHLLSIIGQSEGPAEVAVLCIDLDGFKGINDRYGHAAGDWVLIHVADILRQLLSPECHACRIGGDEFVVLLPGWGEERVRSFGRTMIAAAGQPFDIGRAIPARIGASVGAAITSDPTKPLDDLLEEADAALYTAKRSGKGRLHLGKSPTSDLVPATRQTSITELRR